MLRVGVVIDTFQQPAWVRRVLEVIRSSDFAAIAAVLIFDSPAIRRQQPIVGDWYSRLDAARFRRANDALDVADVRHLLPDTPTRSADSLDHELDVVLSFSPAFIRERVQNATAPIARHGVWWTTDRAMPAFAAEHPTMSAELHVAAAADSPDGVIGSARIGTDRISLHRGVSRLYWKMEKLLGRKLAAIAQGTDVLATPEDRVHDPTSLRIVRAAARAMVNEAAQKFRDSWMHEQWFIAFRFDKSDENPVAGLSKFQAIIPPRDRLWADPFVVVEGGRTLVFVEEMMFREKRGCIAYLELRRDATWSPPRRILERPYHLSYPCVFRWRGEFYMVPETSENRTVELYRCVDFPDRWEFVSELLSGISAVDSTIFELNGLWWMYTSTPSVGKIFDELSVYYAESPSGPWRPHRLNPVLSYVVGGRCGGSPFVYGSDVYRAAQNGARRYGHSLQIRQIVKLTPHDWEEREVGVILPDWRPALVGTHTLNHTDGVTVVDGLQHRWAV
ncbi:MAG: hypothetical protein M3041_01235 [Acidobacteriota bacterium]|nr:hypothetical protein [Acidobacteriota bacterium]